MKSKFNFSTPLRLLALLLSVLACGDAFAQRITVKGHVEDSSGGEIIGATVRIIGTTVGTITDLDGNFELEADMKDSLAVSYIGYTETIVRPGSNLHVVLQEDTREMEEVVVIGYGKVKKNDLTGSVTAISADKMVKGAATSASDMLSGKVAGLSVISSGGAPGAGATIRIRGGSSMSASNNPLIVIDGVPVDDSNIDGMSNPLATIHPNDIETFTVLKDASATAIYGSRASNGVIIITTKKGKQGAPSISYAGSVSINTKRNDLDIMSASEFRDFVTSKFEAESEQVKALGAANTDWWNEIFRTSVSTDHNISVSGALPNTPYRASIGYSDENGILKTSNFKRYTAAFNLNPTFFDKKLNIQLNVKGIANKNRFASTDAVGRATEFDPTQPIYQEGNNYGNGYFTYTKEDGSPIDIAIVNPVATLECQKDQSDVLRSIGNIQADYKFHFLPDLRINANLGYDVSKSNGDKTIDDNSPLTYCSGNYKTGFGENTEYYQLKRNHLFETYLDYDKTFGIHSLDVMAGYSWQHFYSYKWTEYPYSAAKAAETGNEFYQDKYSYETENYLVSFFGRINYTLLERYLLTFTLRNDGSSRFNKDNRWGLFPSAAFAWKIKDEVFLKDVDFVSDLKIRLGYGITGQQNLTGDGNPNDYPYMARYKYSQAGASYYFGNTRYDLIAPTAYDAELQWEETTTYNIGLDFGFLKNRFEGTLDLYKRVTDNLLNTVTAPAGTNFSNQILTNVGQLENKGIEFSLTAHAISKHDLSWTLSYNISYNKNEITKLTFNDDPSYKGVIHGGISGATGYNIQINAVDHPYNSFYVYEQMYDSDGNPVEKAYVDQNKDGQINEDDLTIFKKSTPDVLMGLSSQFNYKNWFFNFAMRASLGNYVYNNARSNREAWAGSQMFDPSGFLKNRLNSAKETNFQNGEYLSSYYIENASFLRMDNITLGYNFDKIFNSRQSAKVYFTVQNPFVITKYSGLDPEIQGEGIDNNIYPRPVTFLLGVNLNF
ncbi:MAG: TonB-dependent receptor [Bacteroidales bacterium]|nr:TonB-dependent receptor [Bacteroidales bacterium]